MRGLGLLDLTTLMVGSVIGSGIFVAPSLMAAYVQTPGPLLGLWVLGGLLTLVGALAYAELAAAMPRAGGQYVFLGEVFGPLWGFLYGWTFLAAINTGFVAAVSVAFAKYLGVFLPVVSESTALLSAGRFTLTSAQAVAIAMIAILTWLNMTGLRAGALVQNVFTVAKVAAIAVLVGVAVGSGQGDGARFLPLAEVKLGAAAAGMGLFAALAVAMSKALFTYDAWYFVAFAAEETREPERNLPRALLMGSLAVTAIYCAAVAAYIYVVPVAQMAGVADNRIAAEVAQRVMGATGAAFIALAIMVSTFGCVNGLILSGARVIYAMGRDGLFFPAAAAVHTRHRTPANALLLQGAVAAGLTTSGTYSDLLTFTAFSSLLFNTLTIVGLFVLRAKQPRLLRPYRALGYPVLPALYVLVSALFLFFIFQGDPRNSGLGLVITVAGLPAYLYWSRRRTAEA